MVGDELGVGAQHTGQAGDGPGSGYLHHPPPYHDFLPYCTLHATAYRVCSDMRTGCGVYVFKAKTGQHVLTDTDLRPAWSFRYRVGAVLRAGESPATSASAITLARAADAGTADTSAPPIRRCATPDGTPALSPLPPDIVVLGLLSATDYMHDLDGHMITVGEVRNDTYLDVNHAAVTAIVYGNDGHKRGQATDQTIRWVLAAGARSPFVITVEQPAETATYSLRTTGRPSVRAVGEAQLAVMNTPHFEHPAGFYNVAGVIENVGSRQVERGRVLVALYDRGRRVLDVGPAYPTQARSTSTWPSPTTPKCSATSRLLWWTDYCIRIRVLMVYLARQAHHNR